MRAMSSFICMSLLLTSQFATAAAKPVVTCGWNDSDDSISIVQTASGQLLAKFSMVDHGTLTYKVGLVAGPLGAGVVYEGKGISINLKADSATPSENGMTGVLNIQDLNVQNEEFNCKMNI